MSPLEKIREGILTSSRQLLVDGYCQMTGEDPESLLQEIGAEDHNEEQHSVQEPVVEEPKPKRKKATRKKATKKKAVKKKATKKKATKKKTTKKKAAKKAGKKGFEIKSEEKKPEGVAGWNGENLFESMIGFEEDLTEDEAKKLGKINQEVGGRADDEYHPIDIKCTTCKKIKSTNPSYINPSCKFVCDVCLSKKKG